MTADDPSRYLNRRSLIAGDVNAGKTTRTLAILELFLDAGYGNKIAVLDLAPDPIRGVGGKLPFPHDAPILYLTEQIAAPRMMGRDATHTLQLAGENARKIEILFKKFTREPRDILFVNDATLYLQAGNLSLFYKTLQLSSTQIINVYYGSSFEDSDLTGRERRLSDALMATCDEVILM